ncbi:DUF2726 domain-containing protein [Thalassotalea sp. PLHSN55]|uniref:DUF2726 domain-containing protein n=1 Tax=Thalassotalea sp. PLHSN55 TaxID=3435888 RepID=UPI003F85F53F
MELILFAMISLIVVVAMLASRLNDNSFPFPFDSKASVFTPAEKNFQILVEQAVGPKYRVINRVKLSDIVAVRKGVSSRASQTAVNNAENKYLDFVICERETMKLLGAIDLVDTQGRGYKLKKDWFVSGALEAASIPHVRIKVKANYTVAEIRACIHSRIMGKFTVKPKVEGKVIPAPMIKDRSKNIGAISPTAARAKAKANALQLASKPSVRTPEPNMAALPH